MNRKNVLITSIIASLVSIQSFAECDREKAEAQEFKQACDNACAASVAAGIAGGIIFPFVGGLIGLAPGSIAQNQCRIKDEKNTALDQCEKRWRTHVAEIADTAKIREYRMHQINLRWDRQEADLNQYYIEKMNNIVTQFKHDGYDVNDPTVANEILAKHNQLKQELDRMIQQNEEARKKELSQV